jgi:hypothetical protein
VSTGQTVTDATGRYPDLGDHDGPKPALGRFRADRRWTPIARWTLLAGVLTVALVIVLKAVVWSIRLDPGNAAGAWGGLIQRLVFLIWSAWQLTVAARLRVSTKEV